MTSNSAPRPTQEATVETELMAVPDSPPALAAKPAPPRRRRFARLRTRRYWSTIAWRVLILVVALAAWQFLPKINYLSEHVKWLNSFFISSPTNVYHELVWLMTGENNVPSVWPYLWVTVEGTLIGVAIGVLLGMVAGLILSNNERLAEIVSVYVTVLNAVPRIALIPIVVVIFGIGLTTAVVTVVLVVSFVVFFNAYEGGRSVPKPLLQNAQVLKAGSLQVMLRVRLPYIGSWVFAAMPNAVAFGLIAVVTAELLTGSSGMGGLLEQAIEAASATLTFAVVTLLSVVGVILVIATEAVRKRVMHWAQ